MSKSRLNHTVNSSDQQTILKKKARRQKAIERAMESLESRMMLSVSGFQPAVNYNAGVGPSAVARGDFNNDGKMDLFVANQTGGNVSILSGNGNGTFGAPANYAAGNGPRAVVTGDFNGDGKLDIAVADAAGNNISVLLNNGSGGFNPCVAYSVGTNPLALVAGDFNGDGRTDLAIANYQDNSITVLAGNGDGTFGNAQTFSVSPAVNVGTGPNAIVAGDFNGDQKIDLAVSDAGGGVSILLGNGNGGFGAAHLFAAGITPNGLVTGIFNGDANLDLAVVNATGRNISVLLGNGDGSFGSPTNYAVGFGPQSITAADFNNDAKMDLAVVNTDSGTVGILSGRGDGTFGTATNKSVGTSPQAVVAGDFNGDGSSDLAVVNQQDDNVSVLLDKHITTTGLAQNSHEGEALTGVTVATFIDSEAGTVVGDYTASINWGDGTSATAGGITFGGGHYSVAGSHTYAEEGVYTVTITVQDTLGTTSQATTTASIRDAALNSAAAVIAVNEGATFNNTVATFNDSNTAAPSGDFTAVIQWGDNTSSNGTIVSDGGGAFHVTASHVWHHKSTPNVTVVISDVGNSKTTATYAATIADAPLTPAAGTPVFTEGSSSTQTIATFADANPFGAASEFSAVIHWGDGSSDTVATISANGSGGYDITGTHSYVHSGNKSASVSITSVDGQTASQNVTPAVQNAAMTATASNGQYVEAIPFSNAPVAHFTDANSGATVGDFTATIDWGDGTALDSNTTIVVDSGNPGFFVKGDHTYLHGSHPTVTVTILGAGGTTLIRTSTSQVLNQTLSAYGPFQPVVNKTTPGELYRGVSGAFNTNNNTNLGIISASGSGGVTYMAGNGNGTFQTAVNYSIGNGVIAVAASLFNAGAALDIVTANTGGGISIALGNGDGTFASPTNLSLSGNVHDVAVGDFNHDGNLDIATANYTAGTVSILMGAGNGTFASAVNYGVGNNPSALTVADLNGDGKMDLAVVNYSDGTVSVLLNNGDGTFATAVNYTVGIHPVAVKAGNLAGDGKIGLVVSNNGDNTVSVLKGNGDGTFISAVTYATGLGTQDLELVDLYGTGKPDILTAAEGDGAVSILINKGDGTYAPQMKMPANHGTLGLVTGDFNGDGRIDLVANSFNASVASVFINNATPVAAVEGTAFSGNTVLMHFTDPNGAAVAADFPTVSINWGDGQTTGGSVIGNINGGFDVIGGHAYDHAGKKTVISTVTGAGEGVVIGATKVAIANAALSLTSNTITPTEGSSFNGRLAHFTDANAAASAVDFTASIVWGDGTTTVGTVVAANGGGFDVNGTHTYLEEGTQTVTATITGLGGGTADDHAAATIADAALHSTGADITGIEGAPLTGVTVASFTDDDPAGTATDYTATIRWGDASTSAGTIAANGNGGFNITGTHTYLHAGDHAVSVNIADAGGASTSTSSNATVNNATVTASAGAFTSIETQSHTAVIATFTDVNTSAVNGDFTATIDWGDGGSADHTGVIAATANPGEFSLTATHTYGRNGSKPVSITFSGAYGTVASTTLTASVAIDPTITANTIAPTEGAGFNGTVAHFTDASSSATTSDFAASINWGDGSTTTGTITAADGGGFDVAGIHTYAEEGSQNFTVTLTNSHGTGGTANSGNTATIADAALQSTAVDVSAVEGTGLTGVTVATFTDGDPAATATDYTAIIHWGDNTTSAGTITANANSGFDVTGTHTYLHAGDAHMSVVITDAGTATTTALPTAQVANATVAATPGTFTSIETQSHTSVVANFIDSNATAIAGDFTAVINWGDGITADAGVVTADGIGGFNVTGTHTYGRNGAKPVSVTISGAYGTVASTSFAASVAIDPTVTANAIAPTEGTSFSGTVAHFTDASSSAATTDFIASVNWGDGTTTAGTVTAANGGGFDVAGTHTYAEEGSQSFTVTITNSHGTGGSASNGNTATIVDAALHSTGVDVNAVEGTALTGVTVASFTDDDPAGTATDYTAVIHWGDNTTSAGTITANGNSGFDVTGTHTYLHAGDHPVTVNIADAGGASTSTSSNGTVNNDTVIASAGSFTSTEGSGATQAIATFTDANTAAAPGDFGATVTWGDGSTSSTATNAVIITGSNGNYSISGTHQYDHAGSAPIFVAINGAYNQVASTSLTATIHNAALSHVDSTFTATEGTSFSGVIGHFSDANTAAVVADFSASINWGDGVTTNTVPADITPDGTGGFYVHGTHTYAEEGAASVATTITGLGGGTTVSTYTSTVADAALTVARANITAIEGTGFTGKIVASFTDADPNGVIGDYTASINWGDGHSTPGTLAADGHGGWNVSGDYLYAVASNYVLTTTISDSGGATRQATSVSAVVHGTISATGVDVTAVEGTALSGSTLVAHFTDTNLSAVAGDFTATIDWGDGSSSSSATVTANAGGGFDVKGAHTYNHAGTEALVISITGAGDSKTAGATSTVNNNTITATGNLNTAVEGTAFIGNVASFTDANGAAVKGDFTAMINWNDGTAPTTATLNDKNGGGFNIAGIHTYTVPASYAPTVTITGNTGQTFTGAGVLGVVDATLNPASVTIHATEGAAFSGTVGTFQDQNHGAVTGDFSASINWGDSHTDTGTITASSNGAFTISGGHTWASAGSRNVVVTINDGGGAQATISSTAIVGDATLAATGQPVSAVEGTPLSGILTTTFGDANPLAVATDFTATITWGDNSGTTAGAITKNATTGLFEVTGNHTYIHAGTKTISVVINDVGGAATGSSSTATIANATLGITAGTAGGIEGQQIVANVANFSDANASAAATDFTAVIDWGDNATSVGAISVGANSGFDVLGAHIFAHAGPHTVTVTINGNGGGTVSTTVIAAVTNAALAGTGKTTTVIENQSLPPTVLANFTDANTHALASDFTATINWNDGSPVDTHTTVTDNVDTGFDVAGTHTYLHAGDKAPVVTLHGIGGGTVNATATIHVTNDTLAATGIENLTVTEGVPFSNAPVSHFTDANPNATAGDFTATIDWGDFLSVDTHTHIVANLNGGFDVLGDRTYAHAGNRPITTTITGNGGGTTTSIGNVHVLNATLASTGKTLNTIEGTALGNTLIAHFTDANPSATASDFSVTIDWNHSAQLFSSPLPSVGVRFRLDDSATIVANRDGGFDVMANHTYNHSGNQTYAVTIHGSGGGSTTAIGTVHVANAVLTPSAAAFNAVEGIAFAGQVVGHFTDVNPNASADDFTATVFWGDLTPADMNTNIVANEAGGFDILAGHTYAHAGDKILGIQINGAGGTIVSTPNTAHVDNGELIPTGYRVTAIEGTAYTGIVAHFTDANAAAIAGEFTAAINWGDGTTGTGTISANDNGGFDVTATHTYNPQGTRTITTTITGQGNGEAVAHSTMLVQDALLNAAGKTIAGTLNVGLNNVVIASFVDGNPLDAASHFSAVITWETGSTAVGTIIQTSTGHYNVTGSHTYSTAGNKTASVLIQDEGGSLQIVDAAVNVAGPGLNATFTPFTATEGTGFTGKLTHFTTTLGSAVAGNFTALIDWADGTTTAGTVIPGANGGFDVNGGHTWRLGGYKPVSVRVNNAGSGAYVIAGGNNYVGVKPITAKGVSLKGKALIPLAATIANFTSANPLAITGDFTATILWGDGTSSAGTVVAKAGGGYAVLAAHTYAAKGTFTAKVTINGISGATAVATSRITVAKGVVSSGPTVGGGHGTPPPTTHGGNPSVRELKFGAWDKPQQLFHGI